jgi:hypothetical protein
MNLAYGFSSNNSTCTGLPLVRVIRWPDGRSTLTRISCPNAWVYRVRFLCPEDCD